jgi:glycosyltransferase involved in cell wall biosynthesis
VRANLSRAGWAAVALPVPGPLVGRLRQAGAEVLVIPMAVMRRRLANPGGIAGLALGLSSIPALAAWTRAREVDLVHSNTSTVLSGAVLARLSRRPHVLTVREDLRRSGGELVARALRAAPGPLVAISETVRDSIAVRDAALASRTVVVRDGVSRMKFDNLPGRAAARRQLGLDDDSLVVATIAMLKPWKGQLLLVEAAHRLADPRLQLLIPGAAPLGDEAYEARLRLAVEGLPRRAVVTGVAVDPAIILAAADVIAAPSTSPEPYGLGVVDALVAGRPVIASAHGGHLETVRHGIDGLLVPPRDVPAVVEAIRRLLDDGDLRRRLGEAGRAGGARFDPEPGHAALWAVYDLARGAMPGA